ncbi:hypothetical protein [Subtercola endophyticus]|nr:hypothetical protein [Subtercola endophyticus]UFS60829.1 hypothetical protein LQ955_08870 [Subtercola endophyticus]
MSDLDRYDEKQNGPATAQQIAVGVGLTLLAAATGVLVVAALTLTP